MGTTTETEKGTSVKTERGSGSKIKGVVGTEIGYSAGTRIGTHYTCPAREAAVGNLAKIIKERWRHYGLTSQSCSSLPFPLDPLPIAVPLSLVVVCGRCFSSTRTHRSDTRSGQRSRSHARLRRNATMSHAFSCVQPAFIDL
ncbi:hypothetical protein EVAR_24046_1 [Eumeta japonica]|uniref:Uncharacterized protein n=1 Tax=Eumeta variegata TaxID=151549 RepID=A0A4C1VRD0_EUMVA|nr:hypothetical protein EVAR_24046_1 [Eumeta japonica]